MRIRITVQRMRININDIKFRLKIKKIKKENVQTSTFGGRCHLGGEQRVRRFLPVRWIEAWRLKVQADLPVQRKPDKQGEDRYATRHLVR